MINELLDKCEAGTLTPWERSTLHHLLDALEKRRMSLEALSRLAEGGEMAPPRILGEDGPERARLPKDPPSFFITTPFRDG